MIRADDIVHHRLTVANALYYTARMRLPNDFTHAQIKQRVDEVLEDVDLKHRRRQMVSKLSGGERKRISIALELLANPSVFFLDKPSAGLDLGLDLKMMLLVNLKAPFHQGIFLPIIAEIYITMALAALAGLMIGLLISAVVRNTDRAMSFVPLVLIPQVIFSGAVFKLDTPILQTVGALFSVRWAMAGMGSSIG
jgi:ABC-type molybdate transport system ATPase subunit